MRNRLFLFCTILLNTLTLQAQKKLTGHIVDASGAPLSGATVSHGKTSVATDKDGNFSIDCPTTSAVKISFVGFATQSVPVGDCDQPLAVTLQADSRSLDAIEISASSNANKKLLYQPAAITKLGQTELKRGTGLYLDDAILVNVPGVVMNRRSVGGGQQFNIRGYGNGTRGTRGVSSNFDGQGYKVYLNGIAITDAEGITTMDDLDFASMGNIEVTKGPAGSLYGLAIAGAVNLHTVRPEKGQTSLGQEVMLGNYGLRRYTTTFQSGGERSAILLNYGNQHSDGYSIHNASKKQFVNFVGDFTPNEKQSITTFASYANSYDQRLGELTIDQYNAEDYSGNPDYIKRNGHSNVITFRAGVGHTYAFTKNFSNTTTVFGTGFTSNASSAGGWTDKNTINYGLRSIFDTRFTIGTGISLSGITGVETQRQDGQVVGYNMKQDPNDTAKTWTLGVNPYWVINANTSNTNYITQTTSWFTEWTLGLPSEWFLTGGLGLSSMNITLYDRFNPALATRPNRYDKAYNGMVSPKLALNKVFNKQFSVYASWTAGYKPPTSSYFFITTPVVATVPPTPATGRVNEDLKPEKGGQIEIGAKGDLMGSKLHFEAALYQAKFQNKMTAVSVVSPLNPNSTLYTYVVNGGEQIHKGLEVLARYTVFSSISSGVTLVRPFVNYTYSDFKYGDNFKIQKSVTLTEDYSGKKVAAVAPHVFNMGVDLGFKYGLYGNLTYTYRDKMPITSLNDQYASSYNLVNAKLGIRQNLGRHFDLDVYAGGTNLTGVQYYIMVFANQLPDAYIPAPRKTQWFGGVNLKYRF